MDRELQRFEPATLYYIRQHAEFGTWVYIDDDSYNVGLDLLQRYSQRYHVPVHAYCLMPDHLHLLLESPGRRGIPEMMRDMLGTYSKYMNTRYRERARNARRFATTGDYFGFDEPDGSIWNWQRKYGFSKVAWPLYDVVARFIETEPVRAAEAATAQEYTWSSAQARIQGRCRRGLLSFERPHSTVHDWTAFHALPDHHPAAQATTVAAMVEGARRRMALDLVLEEREREACVTA